MNIKAYTNNLLLRLGNQVEGCSWIEVFLPETESGL